MPKTGTIHARIDEDLKAKADKILNKVGVTPTDLITMLYRQVVLRGGVPFDVQVPNAETQKAMRELDAGKGEPYRGSTKDALDEMIRTAK